MGGAVRRRSGRLDGQPADRGFQMQDLVLRGEEVEER